MTTTVEFAVQISCDSCVTKIENSLKDVEGVKQVKVSKENSSVLVESELPSTILQEKIESTGRKAILKGCGGEGEGREVSEIIPAQLSGICKNCQSDDPGRTEDTKDEADINKGEDKNEGAPDAVPSNAESGVLKRKRIRGDSKSDDEEELELKYSSDSEDVDFSARLNAFNTDEDIWKIDEDLDAEFDVIDADGDRSDAEDKGAKDVGAEKKKIPCPEDGEKNKTDAGKTPGKKNRPNVAGNKFLSSLKASKVRKGQFNMDSFNIARHVLILPVEEGQNLTEAEAQEVKDLIVHELFQKSQKFQANEPGAFLLKFIDCKLVDPGWLLINCDDDATFNWLLSWDVPKVRDKSLKAISALDKAPLQSIKFFIKSKWALDEETMLKLIHLQNRDIDTKRWILEEKNPSAAPAASGTEQFNFKIDCASVRALEKLEWSFFYELFAVKVVEYNGKPTSTLLKGKQMRTK